MLYSKLAEIYEKLESNPKRLAKTAILADFFTSLKENEGYIVIMATGSIFPVHEEKELGISSQLIIKSISKATGASISEVEKKWKSIGDLGKVAEQLCSVKKQSTLFSQNLTVEKVYQNILKVSEFSGSGAVDKKVSLVAELLAHSSSIEARYIVRSVLEELRIGVGEGSVRDAIVWSCFAKKLGIEYNKKENDFSMNNREEYNEYSNAVQEAYDLAADFSIVFAAAKKGIKTLKEIKMISGKPLKVMLALKVKDIEEGFEVVGKPCALEFKYDGFRMMINKMPNGEIKIFTRRLDEVTKQFPEVIEYVKKYIKGDSFIIDSEAVGYNPKTKKYKPFQEISQRIRRKYDIEKIQKELPVEVNVFDIIFYEGKNLLKEKFKERRKLLQKIIKQEKWKLKLAEQIITSDIKEAEEFYQRALDTGEEGIMLKNLDAPYKPGARVGHMIKLKPELREFDLVITGAEYGTGKRSGWLSSFILGCQDEGKILELGKVGTGIKEKEEEGLSFKELTKLLKPLIIEDKGREIKVKPEIVVTIIYQEIQKSPSYSSGYALRFPRMKMLRPDRTKNDIAFLSEIEDEYHKNLR
jgi:DNA ligase-1